MRLAGLLAAIAFASAAGAAGAQDYPVVKVRVEPVKVTARVWYVQGKAGVANATNEAYNANAGFVVTDDGVVVIDALGSPALGSELVKAIRRITSKPIRRVIVTHYHADHFYGLKPFKDAGADIWAHRAALEYLTDGEAERRREQRTRDLSPWVTQDTPLIPADRWLDGDESFIQGGIRFEIQHFGPAHTPEDLVIVVPQEGVVFSGDLLFTGRVPFVGEADSKAWLVRLGRLIDLKPRLLVTGHGEVSKNPAKDLELTRDYLTFLRTEMGKAVEDFVPFEDAYKRTDWSRYANLPAFEAANRVNAYGTFLLMERESLGK
ncbi:MAG: MBL fold metallo-hydrolase [Betaproteobacteria bacterium]|nr:MBL fold metallo-hydrolase [Betaproteobacteria bacterium]